MTINSFRYYEVPCNCGGMMFVTTRQAGSELRCSGCEAKVAVPSKSELGLLQPLFRATPVEKVYFQFSLRNMILLFLPFALISSVMRNVGWEPVAVVLGIPLTIIGLGFFGTWLITWISNSVQSTWDGIVHPSDEDRS